MFTAFLKKLLFARQFSIIDGKVEILGKRQLMLPSDVILSALSNLSEEQYGKATEAVKGILVEYAKKLGSGEEGMLKNLENIFETFGLGHLELMRLDNKGKTCIVRVHQPPITSGKMEDAEGNLICMVLSGMFAFFFGKSVHAKRVGAKGKGYEEYIIK